MSSKTLSTQQRPGSMRFGENKVELLRAHFPKCSDEIETVLESKHGSYGLAYDELSSINRKKKLNSSWDEAMQRTQKVTESFIEALEKGSESLHEFWSNQWNDSYEGFCRVRDELAELREVVYHGNAEKSREQEMFRSLLNRMIRSNAKEWFAVWGELDLHRLSPNDAVDSLHRCICTWMWDEVRIISGQRAHNGDHVSKGVLFDLIHSITGRAKPDGSRFDEKRVDIINATRVYIVKNEVEALYYSDGGALYLKRSENAQMEFLDNLDQTLAWTHVSLSRGRTSAGRASRQKSRVSGVDGKWLRGSGIEGPEHSFQLVSKKKRSQRTSRLSMLDRKSDVRSPNSCRRSPRFSKGVKKPLHKK